MSSHSLSAAFVYTPTTGMCLCSYAQPPMFAAPLDLSYQRQSLAVADAAQTLGLLGLFRSLIAQATQN